MSEIKILFKTSVSSIFKPRSLPAGESLCRSCSLSKRKLFVLSKHTGAPFPIYIYTVIGSLFCLFQWYKTLPSASAVIGFHLKWVCSGHQQITSACFSSFSCNTQPYIHRHPLTQCMHLLYTYTFTLGLCVTMEVFIMRTEMSVKMGTL